MKALISKGVPKLLEHLIGLATEQDRVETSPETNHTNLASGV
ncbi:hypothetical protein MGP2080_12943 [marine gamma proteobacterium HTCC2080]|nr:hypothetical protein MGP2080_12943 [marine gamma proteobacterium HTCC2080]